MSDVLKRAEAALDMIDEFADDMMRSREWAMRAQTLALLSLAQDVRRVADALEAMQGTNGEGSPVSGGVP